MDRQALLEALAAVRSRGEIKRLGKKADSDDGFRQALIALAVERGAPDVQDLSGKKLIRMLLARHEDAQVRRNPIHRDEAFVCVWCGESVEPGGVPVRDHCPRCLRSRHVDVVPGDRSNSCRGVLHPTRFELREGGTQIHYICSLCSGEHRVRAHPDDRLPPSLQPGDLPGRKPPDNPQVRTFVQRVLHAVHRQHLWEPGQRVLVAVSGGVDSTVLLEVLAETAAAHGGKLEVMSLDHGLRPDSAADVEVVRAQSARLGLPFDCRRLDITPGPNLAARARAARREALLSKQADRIATAHHETDQAETVLQHLLRGSGTRGLRGMLPLSAPWCRPLLGEPREVIEAWARYRGLSWREDPSNPESQRGEIRKLMPTLDRLHGGASAALARSARLLAREDDWLQASTRNALKRCQRGEALQWDALRREHPAIQLRLLQQLVRTCPGTIRADHLEAVLDWQPREGGRLSLPAGWAFVFRDGMLVVDNTP